MHHSSPLPHTRVTRHAPSHPHFSRGAFFAFTLHLHPYPTDIQTLAREHYPHFLLHRGEGKGGAIFTHISLSSNDLRTIGEEVKAKIEKRRTRPRARKTSKNGPSDRGSEAPTFGMRYGNNQTERFVKRFLSSRLTRTPHKRTFQHDAMPHRLDGFVPSCNKKQLQSLIFRRFDRGCTSFLQNFPPKVK